MKITPHLKTIIAWAIIIGGLSMITTCQVTELRINHIQSIGTHNSYHSHPAGEPMASIINAQFPFLETLVDYRHEPLDVQLEMGVRHIELDVNADPEGGRFASHPLLASIGEDIATGIPELDEPGFKIFHIPQLDTISSCWKFTDCLETIKSWSDDHPGHVPVMIMIEIKDIDFLGTASYIPLPEFTPEDYDALDAEIRSVFGPEKLIVPDDVRGEYATLEAAILGKGWPTLEESRGKVMFTMCNCLCQDRHRVDYTAGRPSLEGRVLFPNSEPGNPDAAFVMLDDPTFAAAFERIQELVKAGYIVRTRSDANTAEGRTGDTTMRDKAFDSGAQFVSTDYPVPDPKWASGYEARFPGGGLLRCNPLTAPSSCVDSDIER